MKVYLHVVDSIEAPIPESLDRRKLSLFDKDSCSKESKV